MDHTGVIILAHGSRGERGIVEVAEVLRRVTNGIRPFLSPEVAVVSAALQFNHPDLEEAVKSLVTQGVSRILIMPYFLFSGKHITEHIPELIEKLKVIYPDKQFIIANPLGFDEHFIGQVVQRIEEAVPELLPNTRISPDSPEAIEQQSMEIVEKLLPPPLSMSGEERAVVKRVVHASGDPEIARLMKFSPSAIPSGLSAMAKGGPIFTDVRMVAAGINSHLAKGCGCSLSCAMDETEGFKQAKKGSVTRTAAAIRHLGTRLNGAIVAIGNAPTALLALLDLIDGGEIKPALVVGMPVGFVQAKESKEELMKRDVPYITVRGTRGGSAMAAATVNALLQMAVAEDSPDSIKSNKSGGVR